MEPPTRNRWGNEVLMADEQKAPEVQQGEAKANPEAKYTDKDVDEIVSKKFAQWKSKHEAEVAEAQKLAEMNATEKAAYELKKANERIAELEGEKTRRELAREVRTQLKEAGIDAPDGIVSVLVGKDAEATKKAANGFAEAFAAAVEEAVKRRLAGAAPAAGGKLKVTREQIMAIKDRRERQQAIAEHAELFN